MTSADAWELWLGASHERRAAAGLERRLAVTERPAEPIVLRGGRALVNLSSNNYLGLATHPVLIAAARAGAGRGAGVGSSRLVAGHDRSHRQLEEEVASFKRTERALVFGSGYLANVGVLSAVLDRESAVFSDRLNHASIIDGARLSRAERHPYRHRDLDHLEALLEEASRRGVRRKLIVTDTVFSMDGDVAPLAGLVELKERYGAALMVDEAHAGGVFGPRGEGLAHELGLAGRIELDVGTFSKAFGVYGAYVAGSETWIRHLLNVSRTLIYTTGLPPAVIDPIRAAIGLVREGDQVRAALREKAAQFRERLGVAGFDTAGSSTQIVPILVGTNEAALRFAATLEQRGVLAVPIRPPTVPEGTARLRFSLTAAHDDAEIERALTAIEATGRELGVV